MQLSSPAKQKNGHCVCWGEGGGQLQSIEYGLVEILTYLPNGCKIVHVKKFRILGQSHSGKQTGMLFGRNSIMNHFRSNGYNFNQKMKKSTNRVKHKKIMKLKIKSRCRRCRRRLVFSFRAKNLQPKNGKNGARVRSFGSEAL